jgi:hypothetical protein
MRSLINYLDCGNITIRSNKNIVDFRVSRFSDIINKIIPFFKKYPIFGIKAKDFTKVADLIKDKNHLNQAEDAIRERSPLVPRVASPDYDKICKIKAGMNKGRKHIVGS